MWESRRSLQVQRGAPKRPRPLLLRLTHQRSVRAVRGRDPTRSSDQCTAGRQRTLSERLPLWLPLRRAQWKRRTRSAAACRFDSTAAQCGTPRR